MSSGDLPSYELYRLQLEEQLRRSFELLYQAHLVELRAYETVARARGEIDARLPPLALTLNLPGFPAAPAAPALPSLPAASALPSLPAAPALPATAPPPAAAPAAPAAKRRPAKRKRDPNNHLYDAVLDALDRLGDPFTKKDLCRVLGFNPSRTTLHSVLEELLKEGTLRLAADTGWGYANRYSKAQAPPAEKEPRA